VIDRTLSVEPATDPVSLQRSAPGAPRGNTHREYVRLAAWIALTDALALIAGMTIAHAIHPGLAHARWTFAVVLAIAGVVWVIVFACFQLYSFSRQSPAQEFRRILEASGIAVLARMLASTFVHGSIGALSGWWVVLAWALALLFVLIERRTWHKHMGRLRAKDLLSFRTLIVGANQEALRIARTLAPKAWGFRTLGFIDTGTSIVASGDGPPLLGNIIDLSDVIETHGIECVFIASSAVSPEQMKRLTRHLRRHDVEVRISANMTDILASRLTVQPIGDLLALSLRPVRLTGVQHLLKRSFDLAVASVAVALTAPIWLASALAIKLTSRGPMLFKQVRVGREGKPFTIYKLRTMVRGAELLLAQLEEKNEGSGPLFKIRQDPRITRVGRWLRRYSLDELPQLLNVLKGEMSLVGPRPPLPKEVATYEDWHRDRLEVRPGITGLWQTGGRSELSFDDYVRLDLFYIENWSITYDLFIMFKTVPAVLSSKGAF
jgi:exopolysaccharide biosynthesis polyprenyl glycosylphosphotransferase